VASERDYTSTIIDLEEALPSIEFDHSVATMLDNLMVAISETNCSSVDRETGKRLAEAVARNPVYANDKRHMSSHHLLMAGIAIEQGDHSGAMRELELARTAQRSDLVDTLIVSRLSAEHRFDEARNYIEEATSELPLHPLRRLSAKIALQQLRRQVDTLEMQAVNDSKPDAVADNG
jgi:hypothetical protein